jgi:putative (di)nucleoside polyphosphate hydrolase
LVRLKDDTAISIDTEIPEFKRYKFVDVSQLMSVVSHFKKPIYKKIIRYFKKEGYL